jgi:hypothetical protein
VAEIDVSPGNMKTVALLMLVALAGLFTGCVSEQPVTYSEAARFPRNQEPPPLLLISRVEILIKDGKIYGHPLYFYSKGRYQQAIQDKVNLLANGDKAEKAEKVFGKGPNYVGENDVGKVWEFFF